jgi:glycosyltransferase involved in cell wall biosynthesis
MRVALLCDKFRPGSSFGLGGFVRLVELVHHLHNRGVQVTVFGYPPVPGLDETIPLVALNESQPSQPLARLAATTRDIVRQRRKLAQYDIVHSISGTSIPALSWISGNNTRFVFDMQNDLRNIRRDYNLYKRLTFTAFSPDFVVFVDPLSRDIYQQVYKRENCAYYPPFIDTTLFCPPTLNEQDGRRKTLNILYAGVLRESKGVLDLLKAMEAIWIRQPDTNLIVAGYGPLQSLVERKAQKDDHVKYLGFVSHGEMPHVYQQADLFTLPSAFEGFPQSILEAMASGLPVITTRVAGMTTLSQDAGVHLVNPGDVESLSNILIALIEDENQRRQDGQSARDYVEKKHSIDAFINRMLNLYSKLLNRSV